MLSQYQASLAVHNTAQSCSVHMYSACLWLSCSRVHTFSCCEWCQFMVVYESAVMHVLLRPLLFPPLPSSALPSSALPSSPLLSPPLPSSALPSSALPSSALYLCPPPCRCGPLHCLSPNREHDSLRGTGRRQNNQTVEIRHMTSSLHHAVVSHDIIITSPSQQVVTWSSCVSCYH